jgi:hypothetical protein
LCEGKAVNCQQEVEQEQVSHLIFLSRYNLRIKRTGELREDVVYGLKERYGLVMGKKKPRNKLRG